MCPGSRPREATQAAAVLQPQPQPQRRCRAEPRYRLLSPRAGAGVRGDEQMPQEGTSPQLNPRALGQWGDPGQAQGWEALAAGRGAGLGASPRLRAAPSRKHGGMHRPPVEWRILWGCPRTHMSPGERGPAGAEGHSSSSLQQTRRVLGNVPPSQPRPLPDGRPGHPQAAGGGRTRPSELVPPLPARPAAKPTCSSRGDWTITSD